MASITKRVLTKVWILSVLDGVYNKLQQPWPCLREVPVGNSGNGHAHCCADLGVWVHKPSWECLPYLLLVILAGLWCLEAPLALAPVSLYVLSEQDSCKLPDVGRNGCRAPLQCYLTQNHAIAGLLRFQCELCLGCFDCFCIAVAAVLQALQDPLALIHGCIVCRIGCVKPELAQIIAARCGTVNNANSAMLGITTALTTTHTYSSFRLSLKSFTQICYSFQLWEPGVGAGSMDLNVFNRPQGPFVCTYQLL